MKILNTISRFAGYISMVTVVVMMFLVVSDVLLRFLFSSPISGTIELTEIGMVFILLSAGWCAFEGMHVKIDLIMTKFSSKIQAWFEICTLLLSLGIFSVIVWQGILAMEYSMEYEINSTVLELPEAFPLGLFTLSFAILCLAIIALLIRRIREVFSK